ncbi:hypothetical protein [Tamlana crocina]|uniref:Uncharacterized protein n=1 Tax=Tamlana crocina TaxID=393006 RepID=A0ABX1DE24_9FLAO|nr:hypothetical protein [Tamlana crocina]NJX15258.1 hypothetical protein [Tamlana crocina]
MIYQLSKLWVLLLIFTSCDTGKLHVIADLPMGLHEASAVEAVKGSKLLWTIEDAGNDNYVFGFNTNGKMIKRIKINNAKNRDWEDLTSDANGNLYIGDFGNNKKKHDHFTIYKVSDLESDETNADRIVFHLPKKVKPEDFEAFFLWKGYFYIFSKENKSSILLKVPNTVGEHTAELVTDFNLDGKHHKITSADISSDGKTIVLLNHDKLWKITNFEEDHFFKGNIEELKFDHNSQKEGICFKNESTVYITDEKNKSEGGNLYTFNLNQTD